MNSLCPHCNAQLKTDSGTLYCPAPNCTYVDAHPINYENDVIQFEGEGGQANRYSSLYHRCFDNGGSIIGRESQFDSSFKRAKKIIANGCFLLRLSQNLCDLAETKCLGLLRVVVGEKRGEGKEEGRKEKHKNYYSVKNISYYSILAACFERENYYEEFNICKVANYSLPAWKDIVRYLNNNFKQHLAPLPLTEPRHIILRVCRKRKVRPLEERAMIEMCEKIHQSGEFDIRNNTMAAIAFWKVTELSPLYAELFPLNDICKNHEKMIEEGARHSEIWKCFDVTPENVRKVFKEFISSRLHDFLPHWYQQHLNNN